jgi:SOS-response transcriptional repressor LexA
MTEAQHRVFLAIKRFIEQKGYSPSYAEIMHVTGLKSTASVHNHLASLERDGYIDHGYNKGRSLAICPEPLHGYHRCKRGHEEIFFRAASCPICAIIANFAREVSTGEPREIRKSSSS